MRNFIKPHVQTCLFIISDELRMAGKNYSIKNSNCGNPFPRLVSDTVSKFGDFEQVFKVTPPPSVVTKQPAPQISVHESENSDDSDGEDGYDSDLEHQSTDFATETYECSLIQPSTLISDEEKDKKKHAGWMGLAHRLRKFILEGYLDTECIYILHATQFRFNNLRHFFHKQRTELLTVENLYEALRYNEGCSNYLFVYTYIGFVELVHVALGTRIPRTSITDDTLTKFHMDMVKTWGIPRRSAPDIVLPGDNQ